MHNKWSIPVTIRKKPIHYKHSLVTFTVDGPVKASEWYFLAQISTTNLYTWIFPHATKDNENIFAEIPKIIKWKDPYWSNCTSPIIALKKCYSLFMPWILSCMVNWLFDTTNNRHNEYVSRSEGYVSASSTYFINSTWIL